MFESSQRRQFQKGLDADKARATRRNNELSLRRQTRQQRLQKRIRLLSNPLDASQGETSGVVETANTDNFDRYVSNVLQTQSLELQLNGVKSLRILLSAERDPPVIRVVKSGVIPKVIQFMRENSNNIAPFSSFSSFSSSENRNNNKNNNNLSYESYRNTLNSIKFESAWVITNIGAGSSECTHYVVQHGAVEAFVELLRNADNPEIAEQAVWGLGNIAGDSKTMRDRVLKTGVLHELIDYLPQWELAMQRNAVWVISNIVRFSNDLRWDQVHFIMPKMVQILHETTDEEIIRDAVWVMVYISNINDEQIGTYLIESGVVSDIMKILTKETTKYEVALNQETEKQQRQNKQQQIYGFGTNRKKTGNDEIGQNIQKNALMAMNHNIYQPCLRFIGNLVTGNDEQTQHILDCGYLDIILPFANHCVSAIRKEIMWSLSNILAGSHQQIEAVLSRSTLLSSIVNAATVDKIMVRREACWCLCNAAADAITEQKKRLAEYGAIEALCAMLKPENGLSETNITMIVEGLDALLNVYMSNQNGYNPYAIQVEECHGLDYLEQLQGHNHVSERLYMIIVSFIKKYWRDDDNDVGSDDAKEEFSFFDKIDPNIDANTKQFQFGRIPVVQGENDENNGNRINLQNNNYSRYANSNRFQF